MLDADVGAVEGLDESHALDSGVAGVHPSDLPAHVLEAAVVASPGHWTGGPVRFCLGQALFLAAGTWRTRGLLGAAFLDDDPGAVEGFDETRALPSGVAGVHPFDQPAHVLDEAVIAPAVRDAPSSVPASAVASVQAE